MKKTLTEVEQLEEGTFKKGEPRPSVRCNLCRKNITVGNWKRHTATQKHIEKQELIENYIAALFPTGQ